MSKNKMSDLRDHLFAALEGLADAEKPLDPERAKQIVNVSKAIIETAKVEVKFLDTTGNMPSDQFWGREATTDLPPRRALTNGKGN